MKRLTKRNNLSGFLPVLMNDRALGPAAFYDQRDYNDYADALEHLAQYEDAEEQGRLVVLPCRVGDKVYRLWPCGKNGKSVSEMVVAHIDVDFLPEIEFSCRKEKSCGNYWFFKADSIGKTVFFSREEAEAALKGATS